MCGFVGCVRLDGAPVDPDALARMRDTMVYRGPDDAGLYVQGPVGLAHRRLTIVDLSAAGHQPMANEDHSLWLVYNGEIYNAVELAASLRARGHTFRSSSDTEVILHLYEEEGERCVERLNGMFAFVLWDARREVLFGARDRVGIKPFNYYLGPDRFVCASEIKAILADSEVPRAANPEYFADSLFAGYALDDKTAFRGIRQLPAGHSFTLQGGRLRTRKYWDVAYDYDHTRTDARVEEELRALLDDAVRIHCRSDARVGCHLSGGLDTSTVVGFAARHQRPLKTFSIRFDGDAHFDETPYARAVARHAGTSHEESTPGWTDLERLFPSLLWHLEVPMPTDGGFAYYMASRLAARHVKVSLTGHGGDEVFAGYPAQFRAAFGTTEMFPHTPLPGACRPSAAARLAALVRRHGVRGLVDRLRRPAAPPATLEELWISLHCGPPPATNPLLSPAFVRSLGGYTPRDAYLRPLREAPTEHTLDRCLYHDLRSYLPGLLHMEDRVSKSVSVESRVPLLDHRIVDFMATVPPEQKVRGHEPKGLLRRAAAPVLPAEVRERRTKQGFPVPVPAWMTGELAPMVRSVLLSPACLGRGVLDPDALRRGRLGTGQLWAALNVELWFRVFIDQDPAWCAHLGTASAAGVRGPAERPVPLAVPA
jgi:asparagine synthase (glutamine-hydrolysing)